MSKKFSHFLFFIGLLCTLSFISPLRPLTPPSTPHIWEQSNASPSGTTVRVAIDFASNSSPIVVAIRIFNSSCVQYQEVSSSGSFSIDGSGYKTTTYTVVFKDALGNNQTVYFSGYYAASQCPCDAS